MGLFPLKSSPHLFSHVIFTEILCKKSVTKAIIVNPTFQNKKPGISSYKRLEESKQKKCPSLLNTATQAAVLLPDWYHKNRAVSRSGEGDPRHDFL